MLYLLLKSLHIFGFTAWFSGLFYLGRIFVYHKEAIEQEENSSTNYSLMETRAYKIICNPAMIITWTCGLAMLYNNGLEWLNANPWMYQKLVLLIALTLYHISLKRTINRLQEAAEKANSFQYRLLNELPTLFLLSIVLLAVFKNGLNTLIAGVCIICFGGILYAITKWYKAYRENNAAS